MESDLLKIAKLKNVENWSVWKFQIRVILISHEVFDVVDGTVTKPAVPGQDATEAQRTQFTKDLKEFNKKDGVAQKFIVTSMERQPMTHILSCKSGKEMWDKLHAIYENRTDASVHVLQQKWFSFKKNPSHDIATHISKIEDLCYTLRGLNEDISESMMITKIIMTLPSNFNHFRSAWDSAATDQKTLANLTSRLIMEETRMSVQENSESSALVVDNGNKNSRKNASKFNSYKGHKNQKEKSEHNDMKNREKQGSCWNCGRFSHKRRDCWHLPGNSQRPETSSSRRPYNNKPLDDKDALVGEMLFSRSGDERSSAWFLDSGASQHISSQREYFSSYERIDRLAVRLGDGHIVYAEGMGRIDVLAYNGKTWVRKYLSNVLYILELKYNLFSMGASLAKNMTFESNKIKCAFYKDNEIAVVGEKLENNNLFTMKIKVDKVENSYFANESADIVLEKNTLQIWHERLAHQNYTHVKNFLKNNKIKINESVEFCDACALGKMHRSPFPSSENRTTRVGEIIHSDLCGPMETNSIGGSRYFLLFKDDFSQYVSL